MKTRGPRLAVRGLILHEDKLLLVNAYPSKTSDLWCAPGGGVHTGSSLPENLAREILEETGLRIGVEGPVLINEFHDPKSGFHQVEVFFRCHVTGGELSEDWDDPAGIVVERRFVSRTELAELRYKPDCLADVAWGGGPARYDALETIVA